MVGSPESADPAVALGEQVKSAAVGDAVKMSWHARAWGLLQEIDGLLRAGRPRAAARIMIEEHAAIGIVRDLQIQSLKDRVAGLEAKSRGDEKK